MQLMTVVQFGRMHSLVVQQCDNVAKQTILSMHISNSSSIKIRNNNSLNYAQTIHTNHQLKHCLS